MLNIKKKVQRYKPHNFHMWKTSKFPFKNFNVFIIGFSPIRRVFYNTTFTLVLCTEWRSVMQNNFLKASHLCVFCFLSLWYMNWNHTKRRCETPQKVRNICCRVRITKSNIALLANNISAELGNSPNFWFHLHIRPSLGCWIWVECLHHPFPPPLCLSPFPVSLARFLVSCFNAGPACSKRLKCFKLRFYGSSVHRLLCTLYYKWCYFFKYCINYKPNVF